MGAKRCGVGGASGWDGPDGERQHQGYGPFWPGNGRERRALVVWLCGADDCSGRGRLRLHNVLVLATRAGRSFGLRSPRPRGACYSLLLQEENGRGGCAHGENWALGLSTCGLLGITRQSVPNERGWRRRLSVIQPLLMRPWNVLQEGAAACRACRGTLSKLKGWSSRHKCQLEGPCRRWSAVGRLGRVRVNDAFDLLEVQLPKALGL